MKEARAGTARKHTWHALDELVGFGVADHEVLEHAAGQPKVEVLAGREAAHAVPREGVHPWLVEGAPMSNSWAKLPAFDQAAAILAQALCTHCNGDELTFKPWKSQERHAASQQAGMSCEDRASNLRGLEGLFMGEDRAGVSHL